MANAELGLQTTLYIETLGAGRAANNCIILRQSRCVHTSVTHESEWLHKNSSDLDVGRRPKHKSDEFLGVTIRVN